MLITDSNRRRMEQPADSPEGSLPDGAEPATSRADCGASASEHKEEEILDSEALIDAAEGGELARVKEIIDGMKTNGVDINHQDGYGETALIWACINEHTEVALELLKVDGHDINVQDSDGNTALTLACYYGLTEVVTELLKVGGFDINVQDSNGETALMRACYNGLTEVALELLKVDGINVNVQDSDEHTALIWACYDGLTEVVIELLKVDGINVNVQDSDGETALMLACSEGHADTALALLRDLRVDRHIKRSDGSNALARARDKGLTAVVTLIEAWDRGDERMPLVKVHHRYLHGDVAAEGAQAQAPHPPGSAITKTLVDKNLVHYISRFIAP